MESEKTVKTNMPELRKDPISDRWVIISPHRGSRPSEYRWHLQTQLANQSPFIPGNESQTPPEVYAVRHADSLPDQPGWELRVIPNKYPAVRRDIPDASAADEDFWFTSIPAKGSHEVIIDTHEPQIDLADFSAEQLTRLLSVYQERIKTHKMQTGTKHVQIFKNHGFMAGATIQHSHSQLLTLPFVPPTMQSEINKAAGYFRNNNTCMFCDFTHMESQKEVRVVQSGNHVIALSAFAARFPFETWFLPKRHTAHFEDADEATIEELAVMLKRVLLRLKNVLNNPDYNVVVHTAPGKSENKMYYHWRLELLPRVSHVAGFELSSGIFINPTKPEDAAHILKNQAEPITE